MTLQGNLLAGVGIDVAGDQRRQVSQSLVQIGLVAVADAGARVEGLDGLERLADADPPPPPPVAGHAFSSREVKS